MIEETTGISGGGGVKPTQPSGLDQPGAGDISSIGNIRVKDLNQLKEVLIEKLGPEKGLKFYNEFVKGIVLQIIMQIQKSEAGSKDRMKKMRSL